jgi:signal peptidase I
VAASGRNKGNSLTREIIEWVVCICLAVILALAVHTWVGQIVTVDGPSMQPGLWTGEKVLMGKVEYWFSKPKRGDIVLARFPDSDQNFIKRVIATGGDLIAINNGAVYLNGKKLDEPYIPTAINADMQELKVPDDYVFVMGDNRNDSTDSRVVGAIPLSMVEGRAYALVWPVGNAKKLTAYAGKLED